MAPPPKTHYEVLGVRRDARLPDIARAHDRLVAEFRKDTTPPDRPREARIAEAFAVLSDEVRRAEYDRGLDEARAESPSRRPALLVAGFALLVAVAGGWYLAAGRAVAPAQAPARPADEIQAEISHSVGRVQAIDLAGHVSAAGVAFTVAKGVMATSCEGLEPGAQVVVLVGTRRVAARVSSVDAALGLCRLAVHEAGSWPLDTGASPPRAGERVYAAVVGESGEVKLAEGVVQQVDAGGKPGTVSATVPAGPAIGGRPLLDLRGRVVAVALAAQPGGAVRHVLLPPGWADEPEPPPSAPVVAPATPEPPTATASPSGDEVAVPPSRLPPGLRGEAVEMAKKFRPPPKVPDDL